MVDDNENAGLGPGVICSEGEGELSRGDLILKGALATGALYGLAAVGPFIRRSLAADSGGGDVDLLNFFLSFEYLQVSLYNRGISEKNSKGEPMKLEPEVREFIETLLAEEGEHVEALKKMVEELGGKPAEKGEYAFSYYEIDFFFQVASELETFTIQAYNGAVPSLKSKRAKELAGSIVQVEGRHAAAVRVRINEEPAPEAFDKGDSEVNLINAVLKFTGVLPE